MRLLTLRPGRWCALLVGLVAALAESRACIWDSDTLAVEQARYPGALTIMAGNFPRHSAEFYVWRIDHTRARLEKDPRNPTLRDDLAVALHKTGKHTEAIQVMRESLAITPDRYETLSNLGTFTIYAGDLPASRAWLQKALAINPNAHFGREKYQLWLVEQLMLRADPAALPDVTKNWPERQVEAAQVDYAQFIMWRQDRNAWSLGDAAREAAVSGVTGMMQFADYKNPVLLEALGDILALGNPRENSVHLAIQAYELARDHYGEKKATERLNQKIKDANASYSSRKAPEAKKMKQSLVAAQVAGETLTTRVREDELKWIAAGLDAGNEFEKKYLSGALPLTESGGPTVKFRMPKR